MKSWIKGGLWSIGIAIILYILIYLFGVIINTRASQNLVELTIGASIWFPGIFLFFTFVILGLGNLIEEPNFLIKFISIIFILLANLSFYFLIGAIIGFIVGKFKKKESFVTLNKLGDKNGEEKS